MGCQSRPVRKNHPSGDTSGGLRIPTKSAPSRSVPKLPRRPLQEPSSGSFNISIMFYRSKVLDYGLDDNLNICYGDPIVPSTFTDVSPK